MQPKEHITVFEHDCLHCSKADDRLSTNQLEALQNFYGDKGSPYYSLIHQGVKFCEYVGVIQVGNTLIEVLPKADKSNDTAKWRKMLVNMMRDVGKFDINAPSSSALKLKPNAILNLYFEIFLKEVNYLLHSGLVKKYRKTEGNATALKGSLQFGKHIQQNLTHQERFYVRYSTYDTAHIFHIILYKAIKLLQQINTYPSLDSEIGALMLNFPEMPDIKVNPATFEKLVYNRKTEHYCKSIEIAKLLLLNYHPDVSQGRDHVLALMFDMNLLWEQFIYSSLRKEFRRNGSDHSISAQTSKSFWKPENGYCTTIRPDIIINKDGLNLNKVKEKTVVLDTKWKNLNGSRPSDEDLKQMYIYHEYYGAVKVALVYPGENQSRIRGNYYHNEGHITEKECSLLAFTTDESGNIKIWQKSIYNEFENWFKSA